jgi:hypothetical protein
MIRFYAFGFALMLVAAPAAGADVLLGTIAIGSGGGGGGVQASSIQKITFEFGYSIELNGAICAVHRVGCEGMPTAAVQAGATYTFTAANTQWFTEIAGRLTNGTSEGMSFIERFFDGTGATKFAAGSGGAPESQTFGTATDLVGNTITRITLTLDDWKLVDPDSFCGGPGQLCYKADMVWRIYGNPVGTPAATTSWGQVKSFYR